MAEIYLAVAQGSADATKLVVQKRICEEMASDPDFLAMFLDEGRLAVRLHHPNIVQTFEVGEANGRHFLAMEFLDGQPLYRVLNRLQRDGSLSLSLQLRILTDVLAGLDYAHALTDYEGAPLGVVHRDVCPQNVFVTYDGHVKLMDFGIARTLTASHHTRPGTFKGRLAYMAPEQIRGATLDRRADVFSVGVMLWEMLSRRRLWKDQTEASIVRQLVSIEPIPPPLRTHPWPEELEVVCGRALCLEPDGRYSTAAEMQRDVERVLVGLADSHPRDLGNIVRHAFAHDRAELQAIIGERVRAHREGRIPIERASASYPHLGRLAGMRDLASATPSTDSPMQPGAMTPSASADLPRHTTPLQTARRLRALRMALGLVVAAVSALAAGYVAGRVLSPASFGAEDASSSRSPASDAVAAESERLGTSAPLDVPVDLDPGETGGSEHELADSGESAPSRRPAARSEKRTAVDSPPSTALPAKPLAPAKAPAPTEPLAPDEPSAARDAFDVSLESLRRGSVPRPIDTDLPYE